MLKARKKLPIYNHPEFEERYKKYLDSYEEVEKSLEEGTLIIKQIYQLVEDTKQLERLGYAAASRIGLAKGYLKAMNGEGKPWMMDEGIAV